MAMLTCYEPKGIGERNAEADDAVEGETACEEEEEDASRSQRLQQKPLIMIAIAKCQLTGMQTRQRKEPAALNDAQMPIGLICPNLGTQHGRKGEGTM